MAMAGSTSSSSSPSPSIAIAIAISAFSIPSYSTTSLSLQNCKKQKGRKHPIHMQTSHSSSFDGMLKHTSSLCIHHNLPSAPAAPSTSLLQTSRSFRRKSKKSSPFGIPVQYPSAPLCFDSRGATSRTTSVCCTRRDSLLQRDCTEKSELTLQEVLQRVSFALGVDNCPLNAHFTAKGRQACFGLEGDWQLTWCLDGRFYEHFNSEEMEFQYGFDGKESPWHADAGGHVSGLELDNLEACLLASWIRTGYWVTEQGQKILLIKKGEKQGLAEDPLAADEIWLSVSLKGKKVESHILVDSLTWLPRRMELKAFGGIEKWEFVGWENVMPEVRFKFPVLTLFFPAAGGKHLYKVENDGISCNQGQQNPCFYTHPSTSTLPRNSANSPRIQLDKSCSPSVKVRSAVHVLRGSQRL